MITVAIPHYNRFAFLQEAISNIVDDPRISEIVVSDDLSIDGSWDLLRNVYQGHPKVRLFRNSKNLDCYANKAAAVRRAEGKWIILLDDDNILKRDYLDRLVSMQPWCEHTVYCPEWAQPHFDYRPYAGVEITRKNVAQYMSRRHFATLLNTANYFFHKDLYLKYWNEKIDPVTADSIYMAMRILEGGDRFFVVPGLQYFHRVHAGSHYKKNFRRTGMIRREIETRLLNLR